VKFSKNLVDTLSKHKKGQGLGVRSSSYYSWSGTQNTENVEVTNGLPRNPLYAYFRKEGTYDPKATTTSHGDGRFIQRNFDQSTDDDESQGEAKKKEKKGLNREAKLEEKKRLKREAKLEEKKRLKREAKLEEKKRLKREAKVEEKKRLKQEAKLEGKVSMDQKLSDQPSKSRSLNASESDRQCHNVKSTKEKSDRVKGKSNSKSPKNECQKEALSDTKKRKLSGHPVERDKPKKCKTVYTSNADNSAKSNVAMEKKKRDKNGKK
jgi:hypothetical protein